MQATNPVEPRRAEKGNMGNTVSSANAIERCKHSSSHHLSATWANNSCLARAVPLPLMQLPLPDATPSLPPLHLQHAMLCYAMLCYAMLCYAMLRYATHICCCSLKPEECMQARTERHLGGADSASTAYAISGAALAKVKAPASVLRLTQRWHDTARSALISTTRPSVTSRHAMPMLGLHNSNTW